MENNENTKPDADTASGEDLEKGLKGFKDPAMASQASFDAHRASLINKPAVGTPHKNDISGRMPTQAEHADRASMFADFMPQVSKPVKKNVNGSYDAAPNMIKAEEIKLAKNGQWSLESKKDEEKK